MTARDELVLGKFYWVKPVWDVDFTPPGFEGKEYSDEMFEAMAAHWSQQEQPALFLGKTDEGRERWVYIGHADDPDNYWPVCWVA